MAFDTHKLAAISTVATAPVTPTAGLSLTVATGEGARFPTGAFDLVVWPAGANPSWVAGGSTGGNFEVIRVTSRAGDVLTLNARAQNGTTARTVLVGDQVAQAIMPRDLTDIEGSTALVNAAPTLVVILNGTTSYTPSSLTLAAGIEGVAGGGGGGGVTGAASNRAGAGGGSGGYFRKMLAAPSGSYTVAVGAKGTGVSNGAGNDGADTTFVNGGTTYTAKGGKGGLLASGNGSFSGGAGGAVSTNADVNASGAPGGEGSGTTSDGGHGGSSHFGGAGKGTSSGTSSNGTAATAYGSGGGGGVDNGTTTNRAGGDGSDGVIVITEYK